MRPIGHLKLVGKGAWKRGLKRGLGKGAWKRGLRKQGFGKRRGKKAGKKARQEKGNRGLYLKLRHLGRTLKGTTNLGGIGLPIKGGSPP